MAEVKKIEALEALVDLRSGITKSQLMEKYGLSDRGLKSLLTKLKGVLSEYSVENRNRSELPSVEREINAKDVLRDLRAGCSDKALMEKYKLSPPGLDSLKTKLREANLLPAKRQINIDPIVTDLKSGVTEPELMEKHQLTLWELQEVVKRLQETGHVGSEDVCHLPFRSDEITDTEALFPLISMSAYDPTDPETLGQLLYVRGATVGLRGLTGTIGVTRVMVLQSDAFQEGKPLVFDAKYVATLATTEHGAAVTEFKISNMAPLVLREFQEFMTTCRASRKEGKLDDRPFVKVFEEVQNDLNGDD